MTRRCSLKKELAGYEEYMRKVRYRLAPWVSELSIVDARGFTTGLVKAPT